MKPLVSGRLVSGFTYSEEDAVGLINTVPFLVQGMLTANGGKDEKSSDWGSFVVINGKLVTGQNPASSEEAANALTASVAPSRSTRLLQSCFTLTFPPRSTRPEAPKPSTEAL